MNAPLNHAAANHALLRDRLAEEFCLHADDPALSDTLDGMSDFKEIAVYALREARRRAAYAEAMKTVIAENEARMSRHKAAAERIRNLVAAAMIEAGETKIKAADMTVTLRKGTPEVILTGNVPPEFIKTTVKTTSAPDLQLIKDCIEAGEFITFAELTNGEPTLTVRAK